MNHIENETHTRPLVRKLNLEKISNRELRELVDCAQSAFGSDMSPGEIVEHLQGNVVVVEDQGCIVGFCAAHVSTLGKVFPNIHTTSNEGMYIGAVAVKKEYQNRGIASLLLLSHAEAAVQAQHTTIFVRTQNFVVEKALCRCLQTLIESRAVSSFSIERHKILGAYGRQLASGAPLPPQESPYADLDRKRGDAYAVFFTITYR